jgi:hypothetical protein
MNGELARKRPANVATARGRRGYLEARTEAALLKDLASRMRAGQVAESHGVYQAAGFYRVDVTLIDVPRVRRPWKLWIGAGLGIVLALLVLGWFTPWWVWAGGAVLALAGRRTTIQVIQSVVIKH